MSKVKIQGSASGSAVYTLTTGSTSTDRTITLPDATGTLLNSDGDGSSLTGTGKVLQVVNATYNTQVNQGGTSYANTGLSVSITPSSTSSKVLVIVGQPLLFSVDTTSSRTAYLNLVRGATQISEAQYYAKGPTAIYDYGFAHTVNYLDSPNTTSATTYKTQFKLNGTTSDVIAQDNGSNSYMTLMEISV